MSRVVISGLGVTSCLGSTVDSYWAALMRAVSMPVEVRDKYARMDNKLLYAIADHAPVAAPDGFGRLGRTSTFAVTAARDAWHDAGLDPASMANAGVAIGTGVGDTSLYEDVPGGGPHPQGLEAYPFKVSSVLAAEFGLTGPICSASTACSASGYAVSLAAEMIRDGEADVMLAGGADGYTRVGVACFNRMGALDPLRCRPFDAARQGTVFGEGAALMVLESEEHARARGHTAWYGAVEGSGWSCDGFHATAPDEGARQIIRAMREALAEAGIEPDRLGCVVPHGTGTPLNDAIESQALRKALGEHSGSVGMYSLKGMLGHTGGAAAAFAILTGALILRHGVIPPNAPIDRPDPDCSLSLHTGQSRALPSRHVLVNAYAFGGNNISLIIGREPR
ncbi:MAG TPA: beta-ketoacyl-[acyl-carrier-protein] synthase family protein [Candidatus Limnocylindrales bacterium]|nr:beta-ketoacyl-[acyl-carrier-protein] synthase family protein [Candidatus Limnocylindrales bacterium]